MDTVYNLPFKAYLVVNPMTHAQEVSLGPWVEATSEVVLEDGCSKIEENDDIDLYFNSTDSSARLYLDALECCPANERIMVDDEGLVYCTPADEIIKIYRSDSNYDALRVDLLQLTVVCESTRYNSFLQIVPKQLSSQEWTIMRDDLESEIRGLAQDIVRRSIGLGRESQGALPPDDLYAFLIINKNASAIMSALLDIKNCPKYKLTKRYEETDEFKNKEIDTETVKHYLKRGAPNNKLVTPRRDIVYDIPENRLLKKIVKTYDNKIGRFISTINASIEYRKQHLSKYPGPNMYETKYIEGLQSYLETAQKLKKITTIIKNADWFREVKMPQDVFIPHSFAVDARYGTLYRLYSEIKKKRFLINLDPHYSYSWKKSSALYEMWCYVCVCRYVLMQYSYADSKLDSIFGKGQLFPYLESGARISVENENSIIEVVYDPILPRKSNRVKAFDNPLYMANVSGGHNRPDICINLYSKKSGCYVGSFIIECKYRKLAAFWNGSTRSSKNQIKSYHNDSKSPLFFDGKLEAVTSARPVHQVYVFTPDEFEARDYPDDNVKLVTFKPTLDRMCVNSVCEEILNALEAKLEQADHLYSMFSLGV